MGANVIAGIISRKLELTSVERRNDTVLKEDWRTELKALGNESLTMVYDPVGGDLTDLL